MYILLTVLIVVSQTTAQGINLALGKVVTVSSTELYGGYNWNGSLAVDGKVPVGTQNTGDCRCCSSTQRNTNNWLTVDLGEIYTISSINVQGRLDGSNGRLQGTTLHILSTTGGTEQKVFTQQVNNQSFTWTAPTDTLTRFVTLREQDNDFLIVCEIRVFKRDCVPGKYGPVCTQDCSDNCAGHTCNQTSGQCDQCIPGKYGDTCTEICPQHCASDVCYQTDGDCANGCKEGYQGQRCESGINLALGKVVTVSSTEFYLYNWNGSLAVDGTVPVVTQKTDDCRCCSSTQRNTNNWLTVDLGEIYTISSINVQGRLDGSNGRLQGTTLHILNTTGGTEQDVFTQQVNNQTFTWTAPTETLTRFVTLREPDNDLLVVCEIRVFKKDCDPGKYGPVCTQDCSDNCAGDTCDQRSGHCDQCIPGKYGDTCTEDCSDNCAGDTCDQRSRHCDQCIPGKYGDTCTEDCSDNCAGDTCDQTSGHCDQCIPGKYGDTCTEYCSDNCAGDTCDQTSGQCDQCIPGKYGDTCTEICPLHCAGDVCDRTDGDCANGCKEGYQGQRCESECNVGKYGANCVSQCGSCLDVSQCNKQNGRCMTVCLPGYKPGLCKEACSDGTYGQNCSFTCGNCVTHTCTKHNGTCTRGCSEGFTGFLCTQAVVQDPTSSGPIIGAVVGSVLAVLIIAVVIAIVLVRRKRQRPKQTEQFTQAARSEENEAFDGDISEDNPEEPNENMYDNWNQQPLIPKGILIHQLYDYIKKNLVEKAASFNTEYNKLNNGLEASHSAALIEKNHGKNRYKNMFAYDHSRVLLIDRPEGMSDYINACYINGFERVKKFIASQGPTDAMVEDFWHMVWQEKSNQIVMLTNLVELRTVKCIQYWPDNDRVVYGEVTITIINIQKFADYCIRTLEITNGNSATRQVDQFHFQAWPDKNVPDSAWSLVNFWREVSRQKNDKNCPTVVHCSAGVGRTGTYIALDCLYNQAQKEGCVEVFSCVETLRRQRVNMVQTSTQYVYLHEAVAEALCIGTLPLMTSHFKQWYTEMGHEYAVSNRYRLEIQHELYTLSMGETDTSKSQGKRMSQSLKDSMPHFIKNCMGKKAFIIMTMPTSGKSGDLKHTIEAHNVTTVVNLSNTRTPADQKSNKAVQYFDLTSWEEDGVPKTPADVPSVVEQIQDWQPQLTESKPILLYSNSVDRCGMLYIILNELHRINMDGLVSVLQAAKSMTSDSFNVTLNWMQYKFCHDVLLDHIQQTHVYQNT